MQKKLRFFLLALVAVLLLGGATVAYRKLSAQTQTPDLSLSVAEDFINFTVADENGKPVQLSSLLGKPIMINFWATWCPYCVQEFPEMQQAYERYGNDIQFMMVDVTDGIRETAEGAQAFLSENNYTFPAYYDTALNAIEAYGIVGFPTTVFLAADGTLLYRRSGPMTAEMLQERFTQMLTSDENL